jgi:hypothetical protein
MYVFHPPLTSSMMLLLIKSLVQILHCWIAFEARALEDAGVAATGKRRTRQELGEGWVEEEAFR